VNEVLAARDTIEYAEDEIDRAALVHRDSSGTAWTGTDGPCMPEGLSGPRVGDNRGLAWAGGTTPPDAHNCFFDYKELERENGQRIDIGAFETDPMIDDDYDEFVRNVLEQDKPTGKPNQITVITNGEENIGTKTKLKEEPQAPSGARSSSAAVRAPDGDQAQIPTGSAARAPGGDQVLFEQVFRPHQLQLGVRSTGNVLSTLTGPTQGVYGEGKAGLSIPRVTPREQDKHEAVLKLNEEHSAIISGYIMEEGEEVKNVEGIGLGNPRPVNLEATGILKKKIQEPESSHYEVDGQNLAPTSKSTKHEEDRKSSNGNETNAKAHTYRDPHMMGS